MKSGMRPIHPGEVLREEFLVPMAMSASELARALHVPPNRVTALVNEVRSVTADTALRLARYFGTTPEFWLGLQLTFDLRTEELRSLPAIRRDVSPRRPVRPGPARVREPEKAPRRRVRGGAS